MRISSTRRPAPAWWRTFARSWHLITFLVGAFALVAQLVLVVDGTTVLTTANPPGLAARLDFTLDDIEDLRIAVGEASAMVLPEAAPGSDLTCRFYMGPGELTVSVAVGAARPVSPDYDSFAWQVLTTLASHAEADNRGDDFVITLPMESGHPEIGI